MIERALRVNASSATALYWGAHIHAFSGNSEGATAYADRALRLSPFDQLAYEGHQSLGIAAFKDFRYGEAAAHYARAIQANPGFSMMYFLHAATLAHSGCIEEAKPLIQRALELEPTLRAGVMFRLGAEPDIAQRFADGARLAGMPD